MRRTRRHRVRSSYAHVRRKTLYSLACLSSSLFALTNSCTYPLSAERARHEVPRSLPQEAYACGVVGSTRFRCSIACNILQAISCTSLLRTAYYFLRVRTQSRPTTPQAPPLRATTAKKVTTYPQGRGGLRRRSSGRRSVARTMPCPSPCAQHAPNRYPCWCRPAVRTSR